MHPRLTDYWDQQVGAVEAGAHRIAALDGADRDVALEEIARSIASHVEAMSDEILVHACVVVVDDLYRAACSIDRWDSALGDYLSASAGILASLLWQRDLEVQYLVDNRWEDMARPVDLFPAWYEACGFVYVCPQVLLLELSGADQPAPGLDPAVLEAAHIIEARLLATELVARCHAENRHFIHLDTDYVDGSFESAFAKRGSAGVLTMLRNEAPEPGTKLAVWYPAGLGESAP